jgi:hypothetical protein
MVPQDSAMREKRVALSVYDANKREMVRIMLLLVNAHYLLTEHTYQKSVHSDPNAQRKQSPRWWVEWKIATEHGPSMFPYNLELPCQWYKCKSHRTILPWNAIHRELGSPSTRLVLHHLQKSSRDEKRQSSSFWLTVIVVMFSNVQSAVGIRQY